jgi:hypothetical protein
MCCVSRADVLSILVAKEKSLLITEPSLEPKRRTRKGRKLRNNAYEQKASCSRSKRKLGGRKKEDEQMQETQNGAATGN